MPLGQADCSSPKQRRPALDACCRGAPPVGAQRGCARQHRACAARAARALCKQSGWVTALPASTISSVFASSSGGTAAHPSSKQAYACQLQHFWAGLGHSQLAVLGGAAQGTYVSKLQVWDQVPGSSKWLQSPTHHCSQRAALPSPGLQRDGVVLLHLVALSSPQTDSSTALQHQCCCRIAASELLLLLSPCCATLAVHMHMMGCQPSCS